MIEHPIARSALRIFGAVFAIVLAMGLVIGVVFSFQYLVSLRESQRQLAQMNQTADQSSEDFEPDEWQRLVARGKKDHCAFMGMTQDEVNTSLGSPWMMRTLKTRQTMALYAQDTQPCLRYEGKECVKLGHVTIVLFSPAGHMLVGEQGGGCTGDFVLALYRAKKKN